MCVRVVRTFKVYSLSNFQIYNTVTLTVVHYTLSTYLSCNWKFVPFDHACVLSCFSNIQLCDPVDCSLPGSSVHGILQARMLEWVAMPSSRGSSWPRDQTHISCGSCFASEFFTAEPPGKPCLLTVSPIFPHLFFCLCQPPVSSLILWIWFF